jgi:hypothetical protein
LHTLLLAYRVEVGGDGVWEEAGLGAGLGDGPAEGPGAVPDIKQHTALARVKHGRVNAQLPTAVRSQDAARPCVEGVRVDVVFPKPTQAGLCKRTV